MEHDTVSSGFQHDDLLDQILEDERVDVLQQMRSFDNPDPITTPGED